MTLKKNLTLGIAGLSFALAAVTAIADSINRQDNPVSPARKINRDKGAPPPPPPGASSADIRSIDGTGNNIYDDQIGAAFTHLLRLAPAAYEDGYQSLAGAAHPSARAVSNAVAAQDSLIPNSDGISDYFWQWGQFLDHDIDLTDGIDPPEPANIAVPLGDAWFDPDGTGMIEIPFNRSLYDPATGTGFNAPREQENEITAWIDASNVYGSDAERARALRANDGTGRLLVSEGDFMPFNVFGLANAGGDDPSLFLGGDVRANEQIGLTVMHTLFVREHNRLAGEIAEADPQLSGDEIYQQARAIVGAQMQVITYEEFLPILIGRDALPKYRGYNPNVDAGIANEFSTAAYRFGHSALSPQILRLDADGNEIEAGHLDLKNAFFAPWRLAAEGGLEPILRGLAAQTSQQVDPFVIDAVRNFLFGEPGSGGFDLASLNIQRGRDHGLPSFNDMRRALGLRPARRFQDISSDPEVRARLSDAYADIEDIDLWVGGLSEDRVNGGQVGALFAEIITRQFAALRDGDRFWYELAFEGRELKELKDTRLSDIIKRNTDIGRELQRDVFHVAKERDGEPRRGR